MVFELSWKTLKDLLEYEGVMVSAPRDVIKESFKLGHLSDGQTWIDLLDERNELVHAYNEKQASEAVTSIKNLAYPALKNLLEVFNKK